MVLVSELISQHPKLVSKLRRFSFSRTAQFVGTLGLLPELLENTIRIEILSHVVAVVCDGHVEPKPKDLSECIGTLLAKSPFASQEDPAEDVFVGCVNSEFGSYRLFQGIFGDGAFLVERLLAFFSDKHTFPSFQQTIDHVLALLKLSDALAERAELPRNCAGSGVAGGRIRLPRWRDLQPKFNSLVFSSNDLDVLGINRAMLEEFALRPEDRANLQHESLWNSSLERHPLLMSDNAVIVIEPSTLARSAVRLMTERMRLMGGWGEMLYQQENAGIFVNDVRHRLKIDWLDFDRPKPSEKTPFMFPAFGLFDVGKPVIMFTYTPPLKSAVEDFGGFDALTSAEQSALDEYVQACAARLEKIEGFSGGMVLVCLVTYGRGLVLGIEEWSDQWDVHIAPLRDWLSLAADGCNAMFLWKLGRHEAARRHYNIEILNPSGIANLVAFWKRSKFRLIPQEMDIHHPSNLVVIGCDFAKAIRVTAIQQQDEHCVRSHDDRRLVRLWRHDSRSLLPEDAQPPIYGAINDAANNRLVGCTKRSKGIWWVVSPDAPKNAALRDLLFQLWDCILSWTDRIVVIAEREWPSIVGRHVEICLELPDFERWELGVSGKTLVASAELSVEGKQLKTKSPLQFQKAF
jgi:hypothetical protein